MLVEIPHGGGYALDTKEAIKLVKGPDAESLKSVYETWPQDEHIFIGLGSRSHMYHICLQEIKAHEGFRGGWWIVGELQGGRGVAALWLPGQIGYGYLWVSLRPIMMPLRKIKQQEPGLAI
jgi:hypothetical protein